MFIVTYYGIRGSIPVAGKDFDKYGGNTTCITVETDDGLFIVDAGSGIRNLGEELLKRKTPQDSLQPIDAYLLFTHTHWDHIQGFPFFVPAYIKGNRFAIFGETKEVALDVNATKASSTEQWDIKKILYMQQSFMYFPASTMSMPSEKTWHSLQSGVAITKGNTKILPFRQNHPNSSLGFRFEHQGKVFVFSTDIEYTKEMHEPFLEFAQGAQVMAFDCQYTPDEYAKGKVGWGHSTYEQASWLAKDLNLPELHMVHHDPAHTDKMLDAIQSQARKLFADSHAITEGFSFSL